MKYAVFSGQDYYPIGGWNDFRGVFATLEEAKAWIAANVDPKYSWGHIVNLETLEQVE